MGSGSPMPGCRSMMARYQFSKAMTAFLCNLRARAFLGCGSMKIPEFMNGRANLRTNRRLMYLITLSILILMVTAWATHHYQHRQDQYIQQVPAAVQITLQVFSGDC